MSDQLSGSIPELERAIALNPRDADSWHRLAVAQFDAGRFDEAARCCRRVLAIDPQHAKALANLAAVLQSRGANDEAVRHYREAIAADPTLAPPRFNLAMLLLASGRHGEALEQMRRAAALDPSRAEWHAIIGEACIAAGHPLDAISSLETALRLAPGRAEWHVMIGQACVAAGRPHDAISSLETALRLAPDSAHANEQLGFGLLEIGDATGALARFRHALKFAHSLPEVASNSLFALNYIFGQTPEAIFAEHAAWGQGVSRGRTDGAHANDPSPERRLRIGYVSGDFREHSVAFFFEPILANHNHGQFEVFCYYNNDHADAVTQRLKSGADHWRPVQALSDEAMADLVREDAIDILVDLSGHSDKNRLPVFGRKPAPVQVTYLGYPTTTGLSAMDYRLTDAKVDPEGNGDRWYSERLVRLPGTMWCYRPQEGLPSVTPPPCLSNGHVTFGSLNHYAKLSPQAIALWARLLKLLPEARLVFTTIPRGTKNESLRERLVDAGVAGDRLELHDRLPRKEFNDLISRIDIALDPFPYGGTTTTCDLLWMGVPVMFALGRDDAFP